MEGYVAAIITGVVAVSIGAFIVWIIMRHHKNEKQLWAQQRAVEWQQWEQKYTKEKQLWEQAANDSYTRGKDEVSEIIRNTCDKIEEDKAKLSELSNRELLIEIMHALGAYSRRLDRIDDKQKCITNYKAYIDDMNAHTLKLSQSFVVLRQYISTTELALGGLRKTIHETSNNIHQLIVALGSIKDLHAKISVHVSDLHNVEQTLSGIQAKVSRVVDEMNTVMTTHDQAPMKKLKTIETEVEKLLNGIVLLRSDIGGISSTADVIVDSVGITKTGIVRISDIIGDMQTELRDILDETHKIREKTDEALDEYDCDSLYSKLSDIGDKLCDMDNNMETVSDEVSRVYRQVNNLDDLANDIGSIKSTVESTLTSYGYDSIPDKLNDMANEIESIRCKVDA